MPDFAESRAQIQPIRLADVNGRHDPFGPPRLEAKCDGAAPAAAHQDCGGLHNAWGDWAQPHGSHLLRCTDCRELPPPVAYRRVSAEGCPSCMELCQWRSLDPAAQLGGWPVAVRDLGYGTGDTGHPRPLKGARRKRLGRVCGARDRRGPRISGLGSDEAQMPGKPRHARNARSDVPRQGKLQLGRIDLAAGCIIRRSDSVKEGRSGHGVLLRGQPRSGGRGCDVFIVLLTFDYVCLWWLLYADSTGSVKGVRAVHIACGNLLAWCAVDRLHGHSNGVARSRASDTSGRGTLHDSNIAGRAVRPSPAQPESLLAEAAAAVQSDTDADVLFEAAEILVAERARVRLADRWQPGAATHLRTCLGTSLDGRVLAAGPDLVLVVDDSGGVHALAMSALNRVCGLSSPLRLEISVPGVSPTWGSWLRGCRLVHVWCRDGWNVRAAVVAVGSDYVDLALLDDNSPAAGHEPARGTVTIPFHALVQVRAASA